MDDEPVAATLLIMPGSEPIRGCLIDAAGHERTFHGWLELSSAIELLRAYNSAAFDNSARSHPRS